MKVVGNFCSLPTKKALKFGPANLHPLDPRLLLCRPLSLLLPPPLLSPPLLNLLPPLLLLNGHSVNYHWSLWEATVLRGLSGHCASAQVGFSLHMCPCGLQWDTHNCWHKNKGLWWQLAPEFETFVFYNVTFLHRANLLPQRRKKNICWMKLNSELSSEPLCL